MKYKAIKEIGGYKVGEEVPADKAEIWLSMYDVPPVEKFDEKLEPLSKKKEEKKIEEPEVSSNDSMLDDYLSRNTNVVKKNIEEDDLSQAQLEGLLKLEISNKNRSQVIKAIEFKLKKMGE